MSSIRSDVLAARRGDAAAFARLVRQHAGPVCAITTAILGSPGASEEVGQEVFVCAWQQLGELEDPDRFGAWLRGIARNRARDALRHRIGRREVAQDALEQLADPAPDPSERLDGERRETALWAALEQLDEDHREVLVLYYREGQSVGQVAAHLELEEATVRKRMSRARERLRDGVEDRLGQRIAHTAPRAAFVAAVCAAVALAPLPARAAPLSASLVRLAAAAAVAVGLLAAGGYADLRRRLPEIAPAPPRIEAPIALGDAVEPEGDLSTAPRRTGELPEHVRRAFLAAEDARFFEHGAVDLYAIGRAALHNSAGGATQGGSTLTQQLAKRMLSEQMPDRSLRRKASEVLLAVELERRLTKDEILARYLDEVYLGAGAWGVAEAARIYFDAPVEDLTLAESALLAGIPAHPRAYGPFDDPAAAEQRRAYVLDQMAAHGWASPEEVAAAKAEALPIRRP